MSTGEQQKEEGLVISDMRYRESMEQPLLDDSTAHYSEDCYRYCNMLVFLLVASNMGLMVSVVVPISTQTRQLYGVSAQTVSFFQTSFFLSTFIFNFPASYLIGSVNIKLSLAIGAVSTIIGAWVRCLVNSSFTYAILGQVIGAISISFFTNAPSQIAARWFYPKNRALATAVMLLALPFFSSLGAYIPVQFLDKTHIPAGQEDFYRNRMYQLFLFEAVYCTVCGILGLILFRERPEHPTSRSSRVNREPFWDSFKSITREGNFLLLAFVVGLTCSAQNAWQTNLQLILAEYGVSSYAVGIFSIINIPSIVVFSLIFALYAGKYKKFKVTLASLYVSNAIIFAIFIPLITIGSAVIAGIINVLSFSLVITAIALSVELAAQLTFPIAEAFTCGLITVNDKLLSFILTQFTSYLFDQGYRIFLLYLMTIFFVLSSILIFCVKERFKRSELDKPLVAIQ